jgi:acylphosphatase
MQRLTAYVSGTVQKTGYRAQVLIMARALGLSGYAQNLSDGRVKIVAEGEEADLERFLKALKIRDTFIDVDEILGEYSPATGEYAGFAKMVMNGETDQRLDKAAELLKELVVVNKEMVKELKATREGVIVVGENVQAVREEVIGVREDVRGVREEVSVVGEALAEKREEVIGVREDVRGVREEVIGVREDVRGVLEEVIGVREDVRGVREEVSVVGEALAEKIDESKDQIAGEIREIRSDLQDDLKVRMARMEADISQIKTKVGL